MFGDLVFRQLFDAASSTYTYLLGCPETREAVLIDTVFEQHLRDRALVEELGLKLVATLDTHCHADHVTGAWLMQQATGCRVGISARYGDALEGADLRLDDGDRVPFGHHHLEVRAAPGHTDGCVTFVDEHRRMRAMKAKRPSPFPTDVAHNPAMLNRLKTRSISVPFTAPRTVKRIARPPPRCAGAQVRASRARPRRCARPRASRPRRALRR